MLDSTLLVPSTSSQIRHELILILNTSLVIGCIVHGVWCIMVFIEMFISSHNVLTITRRCVRFGDWNLSRTKFCLGL